MQFKQNSCNDGQLKVFNRFSCLSHDLQAFLLSSDAKSMRPEHEEFDVWQCRLFGGDKRSDSILSSSSELVRVVFDDDWLIIFSSRKQMFSLEDKNKIFS